MKKPLWWISGILLTAAAIAAGAIWYRTSGIEAALLAQEPFRVLKNHARPEYARVLAGFRRWRAGEIGEAGFVDLANAQFSQVAARRLAHASSESVLALMRDTLATVRKLEARSAEACFRYWFPEVAGPAEVARILTSEELQHSQRLMAAVIRSAAENPVAAPDPEEVSEPLGNIVNSMYEQYGTDAQMVANADDPRADRGKVCTITTAVYERILALPPETGTKLIRVMAAG